jgi:SPP1 family predicted phage head-tail adaptor
MVQAGTLNEQLSFYEVVETQSESGYKHTEERFLFTLRAYRMKNKERYVVNADELFHTNELTFRIYYRKEITETCIVVYEGERYRITSLDPYKPENQITLILAKINE